MALGTNYRRISKKDDFRIKIGFIRLKDGWSLKQCHEEWAKIKNKPLKDIEQIYKELKSK